MLSVLFDSDEGRVPKITESRGGRARGSPLFWETPVGVKQTKRERLQPKKARRTTDREDAGGARPSNASATFRSRRGAGACEP